MNFEEFMTEANVPIKDTSRIHKAIGAANKAHPTDHVSMVKHFDASMHKMGYEHDHSKNHHGTGSMASYLHETGSFHSSHTYTKSRDKGKREESHTLEIQHNSGELKKLHHTAAVHDEYGDASHTENHNLLKGHK